MRIFPNSTQTEEFDQLGGLGFLGSFNDRQYRYLRSLGYDGNLNDMLFFIKNSPVIVSTVPSLFWPINTSQSYNIAQHIVGPGPLTYTTSDTLPVGVTLSSSGVLSGTPTTILTGFIGVIVTAPNGTMLVVPVFLAIQDVPASFTVGQWSLVPVLNGLRVDLASHPADNNSAIIKTQYRLDTGSAVDLAAGGVISTSGTHSVEIRDANAIGAGAWSDVKSDTALTYVGDYPTVSLGANKTQGNATTFAISQPTVAVGDTILHVIAIDGTPTVTVPAGWTIKDERNASNSSNKALVITRTATGSDAVTIDFNGASENAAVKTWVFGGNCAVDLAAATGTSPPNPPSLTLGAAHDVYLIAAVAYEGTSTDLASGAAPSGYSFVGTTANSGTSSAGVSVSAAVKTAGPVTTEDPAAFGGTAAATIAYTIAVYKTVSAPTVATPIPDQTVDQNTGGGAVSVSPSFTGTGITYSVSGGPTGTSINATTGLVTYPTTTAGNWTITVTATNSAGSANDPFNVTINAVAVPNAVFTAASSTTELFADGTETAGFNFVDAGGASVTRLVAQSVTGRWHVIGDEGANKVRVTSRRPFVLGTSGTDIIRFHQGNGSSGNRARNGAMINPTIVRDTIQLVPAGLVTATQGFDNYEYQTDKGTAYAAGSNVMAAGTPVPLSANQVLVQSVGFPFTSISDPTQVGGKTTFRTKIIGHASLAVVPSAPPQNFFAIPPGGADKTLFFGLHAGMVNLGLLPADDLQTAMPGRRTIKAVLEGINKLKNTWSQNTDRSRNMMAEDERLSPTTISVEDDYSREMANRYGEALIVAIKRQPTSGDDSTAYRDALVYQLVQDGLDFAAQLIAGDDYVSGGGFQTGIKAVVAFAAAMLNLSWLKDLCNPLRTKPDGTPLYRDPANIDRGQMGYGFAEHKRYLVYLSAHKNINDVYFPTSGRAYPLIVQDGHVGLPDWAEFGSAGDASRISPTWNYQYRENCLSDVMGIIAVHLISGMSAIFRQDYILQYFDRAEFAKRAGYMKSEAGWTSKTGWVYDTYRTATGVSRINAQPDYAFVPVVTPFVGSGDRLGVKFSRTAFNGGSPFTAHQIRYRTTTPPRWDLEDGGWSAPITLTTSQIGLDIEYFLTALSATTAYYVSIRHQNANGWGAWSTNMRLTTAAKTAAEAYASGYQQAYATTSTNQNVANTTPPFMVGGTAVGDELVIDHGVWSIVPTGYTYQWKRGGVNISGATARTYTRQSADIGQTLTCTVTGANSTSNLPLTATAAATVSSVTRSLSVLGAGTQFDVADLSTAGRTRTQALAAAIGHPVTPLVMAALVPKASDPDAIGAIRAELRTASSTVSSASGSNEITGATVLQFNGNRPCTARLFSVPSTATGADRVSVITNVNAATTIGRWGHAIAALGLAGFDLANARFGSHREYIPSGDVDLYDQMFTGLSTIGLTRVVNDGAETLSGAAQVVPKGSLILGIVGAGPHYAPQAPVWSANMTPIPNASQYGVFVQDYATVSLAYGYQADAGPCSATLDMGGNPVQFVMSLIAIPPL